MGGGPGKEVAFTPWFQIFGNIFIDIIPNLCRRSSYSTISTLCQLNWSTKFSTENGHAKSTEQISFPNMGDCRQNQCYSRDIKPLRIWNFKTCVCSFGLFGFYWLNTDAFGVCCRPEDAIIVDAAAAFSVTTAQISQLRKFNMIYCIISCRCHSFLSRSQLITREDILSCWLTETDRGNLKS